MTNMHENQKVFPLDLDVVKENLHLLADWYWECDETFHYSKFQSLSENTEIGKVSSELSRKLVWAQDVFFALNLDSKKLERVMNKGESFRGVLAGYIIKEETFYVSLSGTPKRDEHSRIIGYFGFATIVSELQNDYVMLRQFRTAMEESGDPIYMVDVKTLKFIDVNATACERMGYSREQLLTLGPSDLLSVSPEVIRTEYMELIRSGSSGTKFESVAYTRSGARMIAEMHRRPVKVGGRWVVISIARNITDRKSAELANIRKSQMYSVLSSAEEAMVLVGARSSLFENVCKAVVDSGKLSAMAIFQLNQEKNTVDYVEGSGFGVEALKQVSLAFDDVEAYGNSLIGRSCSSGWPVVFGENLEDQRTIAGDALSLKFKPRSAVAIPFFRNKKFAGVTLFCALEEQWFDSEIVYILQRMTSSMVHALDKLELAAIKQRDHDRFEYMANYDALTELPNRKFFVEKLESAIENAGRSGRRFALMFIDLDGFKAINDNYGHDYGDALLKELASRFCSVLRENDCVARLGGDEFVVIAGDARNESSLIVIAEKFLEEAARPVLIHSESCSVSASIGISLYSDKGESSTSLLRRADDAMYLAKSAGKNQYSIL